MTKFLIALFVMTSSSAFAAVEVECIPVGPSFLKYFLIRPLSTGKTAGQFFPADWNFGKPFPRGQVLDELAGGRSELVFGGKVGSVNVKVSLPWNYKKLRRFPAHLIVGDAQALDTYACTLTDETIGRR